MKKIGVFLGVVAVLAFLAYTYRLDLLMAIAPIAANIRDPIAPHRPVAWHQGPEKPAIPAEERPPNVVLILADDLGFNDISLHSGATLPSGVPTTPNIDAIATNGVAFRNGYAANAVCAPSRAALMTGRYSTRFGFEFTPFYRIGVTIVDWMQQANPQPLQTVIRHDLAAQMPGIAALGMPADEITLAEAMQTAGYQTAHIGKWHLGGEGDARAERQGFHDSLNMASGLYLPADSEDVVNATLDFSAIDKMVWAATRYSAEFNGGGQFEPGGYLTDYYTDEAVRVIEANRHRPFFLYLAHWAPHTPLQASKADYDALAHVEDHTARVYAAMIHALDRGVGRVMTALRDNGLEENTLVIFTSDNGGARYLGLPDVNHPYRGWKLTLFEGGIHVPFFMQWPARIPAGSVVDSPVTHLDIFTTAAVAAGAAVPEDREIDGVDLLPYVVGESTEPADETLAGEGQGPRAPLPRTLSSEGQAPRAPPLRALFWRQGHHQAVRHGDWKLTVSERETPTGRETKRWLFNLATDPTEQQDLAAQMPDKVAALQLLLDDHNAAQAEPLWPSVLDGPQLIDKTEAEDYAPGDEYIYWPN